MARITKIFHNKLVYSRRMIRLTELISPLLKDSKNVLDVGCGDGKIDSYLLEKNKDIRIQGIDVLVRSNTYINVKEYDGKNIPYDDGVFDTVMAIDVLHHTDSPNAIVSELVRVSSKYVIIKDHVKNGIISYLKLRAMDYVGNAHYHVRLPYNYQTAKQWKEIFENNGLKIVKTQRQLNLYTSIFHFLFDRQLHFIAVLEKCKR
ncbi:MAG: class I SAM-dependent methyltransferase [Lachnospiraceae bacterium]|nr:class I SAM-dependent methyltransferase [Lachnospiraceae bacterium]